MTPPFAGDLPPMAVAAPGLFWTMMSWPRTLAMPICRVRATMSVPPPAG